MFIGEIERGIITYLRYMLHADLTMCFKIAHNLVNTPFDQFFLKLSQHKSTRCHSLKLFYPDSRINVRVNFFSVRVISLPADLVQDNNLIKFESMLHTVDFSFALVGKI